MIPFTERWIPTPWTLLRGEPDETFSFAWKQVVPGAEFAHSVTSSGEPGYSFNVVMRVFCHVLTNVMPEKALSALFQTAKDLYEISIEEPAFLPLPNEIGPKRVGIDPVLTRGFAELQHLIAGISEARPLAEPSPEIDQLLADAVEKKGKPTNISEWANRLVGDTGDLTD